MRKLVGVGLVLGAAMAYGAMPIFTRIVYASGADPLSLLFLRFTVATIIMAGIVARRKTTWPRGRVLAILVLMGAVGYVGQSMTYFHALTLASAGLVSLLLSLYSVFVSLFAAALYKQRVKAVQWVAMALALTGTALTIGPLGTGEPWGVILAICSAIIYAMYILAGSQVTGLVPTVVSTTIIMGSTAVVLGGLAAVRGLHPPGTGLGWLALLFIILVSTVLALNAFLAGLERIHPTDAAMLSTAEPVTTVALAALILNEPVGWGRACGGLLILAAILIISRYGESPLKAAPGVRSEH